MTQRKDYLDIAKGIGIILVVWEHASGPLAKYITQFHMPFFFFISGILFTPRKGVKEYILRKCKSLLFPFWGWNLIFYPLFYVLFYWQKWEVQPLIKEVTEILFTLNKVPFLGTTWFLASLFWISIMVNAITVFLRKNKYCDYILLAISIGVCIMGFMITLPYKQSRTLICSFFYVAGYIYEKYLNKKLIIRKLPILAILSLFVYICISTVNECAMGSNRYRYKGLFIIGALLATYFTLYISNALSNKKNACFVKLFIYLGRNSFDIMIWHPLAFRITIIMQIVVMDIEIKEIVDYPTYYTGEGWWLVYLITGILGSLVWKYILEHNCGTKILRRLCLIR